MQSDYFPTLPDMSDEVHTRVLQWLRGALAPFLLMDEDCAMDEKVSHIKNRRRNIKSGNLRTWDTHVVHRVKWPHEMLFSSQGQTPLYEDMIWVPMDIWQSWPRKVHW